MIYEGMGIVIQHRYNFNHIDESLSTQADLIQENVDATNARTITRDHITHSLK